MKVYFGQIYVEPGVSYQFTHHFQQWLGQFVSVHVCASPEFISSYGMDYSLMIRISAKSGIELPEIKGPTVFKRDKDVEFSIFLPHNKSQVTDYSLVLQQLMLGVIHILSSVKIDTSSLLDHLPHLIDEALNTPSMIRDQSTLAHNALSDASQNPNVVAS